MALYKYKILMGFAFMAIFRDDFNVLYSSWFLWLSSSPEKSFSAHYNQNETLYEKDEINFISKAYDQT